jgi:hypothetical protein
MTMTMKETTVQKSKTKSERRPKSKRRRPRPSTAALQRRHHRRGALALSALAKEIRQAHEAALASARTSLQHARRAGELLMRAKAEVPHGGWLPWLKASCPGISERTAQAYMQVSAHWEEITAKAQGTADLPISTALALVSAQRRGFVAGAVKVNVISKTETYKLPVATVSTPKEEAEEEPLDESRGADDGLKPGIVVGESEALDLEKLVVLAQQLQQHAERIRVAGEFDMKDSETVEALATQILQQMWGAVVVIPLLMQPSTDHVRLAVSQLVAALKARGYERRYLLNGLRAVTRMVERSNQLVPPPKPQQGELRPDGLVAEPATAIVEEAGG